MKTSAFVSAACFIVASLSLATGYAQQRPTDLTGAWQTGPETNESTLICSEKYFSIATYDLKNKRFISTFGGSYRVENGRYIAMIEFHSLDPGMVGNEYRGGITLQNGMLQIDDGSGHPGWKRIDDGKPGKLAGAWLITGRMRDGNMSKMTPGARRTMKILSGTHFQWIAYNVDTKEFAGTGGGTYTTRNGKYTENIEFFSRDNSRVGASLAFDFSLENGAWRHKGLSSKGDPIDEVWTRREKIGL